MSTRSAPEFALSFSSDAVHLMERADPPAAASVVWKEKAVAAFDAPDFRAEMARLRKLVANGPDARVALIIPDDQILYTSLVMSDGGHRATDLGRALDGLTPYPVADLAWDWRPEGAGDVRVAAVARQTLREAEDFARRHGFAAEGFLADPAEGLFPATPQFSDVAWKGEPVLGDTDLPGDAVDEDVAEEMAEVQSAQDLDDDVTDLAGDSDAAEANANSDLVRGDAIATDNAPVKAVGAEKLPAAAAASSLADEELTLDADSDEASVDQPTAGSAEDEALADGAAAGTQAEPEGALPAENGAKAAPSLSAPVADATDDPVVGDKAGPESADAPSPSDQVDEAVSSSAKDAGDTPDSLRSDYARTEAETVVSLSASAGEGRSSVSDAGTVGDAAVQAPDPEKSGGVTDFLSDELANTASATKMVPISGAKTKAAPAAKSAAAHKLVADRSAPAPRPLAQPSERARAVLERAEAARATRVEPLVLPDRHPGERGGIGALVVMLSALFIGLMLIWAFATPISRGTQTETVTLEPVSTSPPAPTATPVPADTDIAQTADVTAVTAPVEPEPTAPAETETPTVTVPPPATLPAEAEVEVISPSTDETQAATPDAVTPDDTAAATDAADPSQPAVPAVAEDTTEDTTQTATQPADPEAGTKAAIDAALQDAMTTTAAGAASEAGSAAMPGERGEAAQTPAGTAVPGAANDAAGENSAPATAPVAASTTDAERVKKDGLQPNSGTSAARPALAKRRPVPAAAPSASEADQLPAVVPGRRALTRSERPNSRPAAVRSQPARAATPPRTASPKPAATPARATTPPPAAQPTRAAPPVTSARPTSARPDPAPRAAARPATTSSAPASAGRPRPRPAEGSADESLTAAEMTPEERITADAQLADLYAANPWLPRLSAQVPTEMGPRFAEARPSRRPGASGSAVDAAVAEAVASKAAPKSEGDRPTRRTSSKTVASEPAATKATASVKAAANTNGRPASRPGRSGNAGGASKSAVESAIAEAVVNDTPAKLASAASLVPLRKPARASGRASGDSEAEAVAIAAAAALRSRPDPAPAAAPVAPAAPAVDETAQRQRDDQLQRQAEERARARAQSDAQAEMQARAAAEARARAQVAAEERAAIAARGSYRPPEVDDEPEVAQKAAEGRTEGDVARNATLRGIETAKTQVIGVIGAGRASRGLIRLRNGKIVTVRLGDRIDGGAINSIGNGKISYVKGGRTYNLPILNGR